MNKQLRLLYKDLQLINNAFSFGEKRKKTIKIKKMNNHIKIYKRKPFLSNETKSKIKKGLLLAGGTVASAFLLHKLGKKYGSDWEKVKYTHQNDNFEGEDVSDELIKKAKDKMIIKEILIKYGFDPNLKPGDKKDEINMAIKKAKFKTHPDKQPGKEVEFIKIQEDEKVLKLSGYIFNDLPKKQDQTNKKQDQTNKKQEILYLKNNFGENNKIKQLKEKLKKTGKVIWNNKGKIAIISAILAGSYAHGQYEGRKKRYFDAANSEIKEDIKNFDKEFKELVNDCKQNKLTRTQALEKLEDLKHKYIGNTVTEQGFLKYYYPKYQLYITDFMDFNKERKLYRTNLYNTPEEIIQNNKTMGELKKKLNEEYACVKKKLRTYTKFRSMNDDEFNFIYMVMSDTINPDKVLLKKFDIDEDNKKYKWRQKAEFKVLEIWNKYNSPKVDLSKPEKEYRKEYEKIKENISTDKQIIKKLYCKDVFEDPEYFNKLNSENSNNNVLESKKIKNKIDEYLKTHPELKEKDYWDKKYNDWKNDSNNTVTKENTENIKNDKKMIINQINKYYELRDITQFKKTYYDDALNLHISLYIDSEKNKDKLNEYYKLNKYRYYLEILDSF
jgi:hypothetical protein